MKESDSYFITREINPRVICPGLMALFAFVLIVWHVTIVGGSSIGSLALIFFGSTAFPMILSPLFTTVKITENKIDWKIFGKFGTIIYLEEIREIRVHHHLFVKLHMWSKWWKPTICPVDREGFLRAIQEKRPELPIKGWKSSHKGKELPERSDPARIFYFYVLPPALVLVVINYVLNSFLDRILWAIMWGIGGFYFSFVFLYVGLRNRVSFNRKVMSRSQLFRFSLLIGLLVSLFFALIHYLH